MLVLVLSLIAVGGPARRQRHVLRLWAESTRENKNVPSVEGEPDATPSENGLWRMVGIKVYATQELALALKSAQPPLVVDVWAAVNEAIPSAVTLLAGGLAFDDAPGDAVYEGRFSGLLKALSPDPAKPIVFYCQSRDCWLSVNASLRAKKLGYSQVGWYRGGMESWKAASLPVGQVIVRAVVR